MVDRLGVAVGRIRRLHRPDPLAVADDGRRIGQASDIVAMLPGWSVHTLPEVSPAAAARLVREGYLEIVVRGRGPVRQRYAALTDITEVEDEVVRLAFCVDELPCQTSHRR
ncbi:hypothetical protein AB0J74_18700 [Asanoa sp. NPDC049573]|uniref:hypothetical protein n=1 Tax=Asanoa sp. NPDC049573 TaxID=3155396 RepID=UPI00343EA6FD